MIRSRYRRIIFFFGHVLFNVLMWELILPRLGLKSWSRRTRSKRLNRIGVQFRGLAIQMGGVLIKVGQFLSARVDVLPPEITSVLSGLQDEVPAEAYDAIRKEAEAEFGMPLSEKFTTFEEIPVAAASLGQVHRATLKDNDLPHVVVKIQRPNIANIIATDLAALRVVGNWLQLYRPIQKHADVPALLVEFTRILNGEIDYIAEGHNAETFAKNFEGHAEICVPRVIWSHTTKRVLTLEDVHGIKITDYQAIDLAGVSRVEVADRLFNTYLKQIFEDGFFHADPHPGNLFIYLNPPDDPEGEQSEVTWQLTFVDFGMVGQVQPGLREGMRDLIVSIGTQDAGELVKSYQKMGFLLPGADLELLEKAEAEAFKRFWGKSMNELKQISFREMHDFAVEFRELIYNLPFQIPEDLILLGRCVGILSGMCTGLNNDFNLWAGIAPYAQRLIAEEASGGVGVLLESLTTVIQKLIELPRRAGNILAKMERGEMTFRDPFLAEQVGRLEKTLRKLTNGLIFAALLFAGVQLFLGGKEYFSVILFILAGLVMLWTLLHQEP